MTAAGEVSSALEQTKPKTGELESATSGVRLVSGANRRGVTEFCKAVLLTIEYKICLQVPMGHSLPRWAIFQATKHAKQI